MEELTDYLRNTFGEGYPVLTRPEKLQIVAVLGMYLGMQFDGGPYDEHCSIEAVSANWRECGILSPAAAQLLGIVSAWVGAQTNTEAIFTAVLALSIGIQTQIGQGTYREEAAWAR